MNQKEYIQIPKDLINDKSISPNCRWLLMYFLSTQDSLDLKSAAVIEHLKSFIGRDKFYKILNEAIEHGYVIRYKTNENNRPVCKHRISEKLLEKYKQT
jgi:hypothetical protein